MPDFELFFTLFVTFQFSATSVARHSSWIHKRQFLSAPSMECSTLRDSPTSSMTFSEALCMPVSDTQPSMYIYVRDSMFLNKYFDPE